MQELDHHIAFATDRNVHTVLFRPIVCGQIFVSFAVDVFQLFAYSLTENIYKNHQHKESCLLDYLNNFQGSRGVPTTSRGVQLFISYRNPYNLCFSGGPDPLGLSPPSEPIHDGNV